MGSKRWVVGLMVMALLAAPLQAKRDKEKNEKGARPAAVERVWPPPPQKPRIKLLQTIRGEADVVPRKTRRSLVSRLVGEVTQERLVRFGRPFALAGDSTGQLYVTDTYRRAVFVIDPAQRTFRVFAAESDVAFRMPVAITVDSQNRVWVADASLKSVLCFDRDEKLRLMFGQDPGSDAEKLPTLARPSGIAVDEKRGRVYVSDAKLHQILVFDLEGKFLSRFGQGGSEPGQLSFPGALALTAAGDIVVVDTMNARVQVFDPDYKLVREIGGLGDTPGNFARPKGVALDSEGHVYVSDAWFHNFQIFGHDPRAEDPQALAPLLFIGQQGNRPGEFQVPGGIYIDAQNHVFVADQLNGRIQVFQFLGGQ